MGAAFQITNTSFLSVKYLGPLWLKQINFNLIMDKLSDAQSSVG